MWPLLNIGLSSCLHRWRLSNIAAGTAAFSLTARPSLTPWQVKIITGIGWTCAGRRVIGARILLLSHQLVIRAVARRSCSSSGPSGTTTDWLTQAQVRRRRANDDRAEARARD